METNAAAAKQYFTFKDYLSPEEAASFFQTPHAQQVRKVSQYLDFLGQQPAAAQFTTSSKASISYAVLAKDEDATTEQQKDKHIDMTVLQSLLDGRTRSGFGAFGTEPGFLPQKALSLKVANTVEPIGHTYIVERNKRGEVKPPVLNSRSFFFYWCHAEKQKLMDVRDKLQNQEIPDDLKQKYWKQIAIVVDRAMCADCIQFAKCFARYEKAVIYIQDPQELRVFSPTSE